MEINRNNSVDITFQNIAFKSIRTVKKEKTDDYIIEVCPNSLSSIRNSKIYIKVYQLYRHKLIPRHIQNRNSVLGCSINCKILKHLIVIKKINNQTR